MKTILIYVCVLFIAGCNAVQYRSKEFKLVDGKPVLTGQIDATYNILNANVSDKFVYVDLKKGVMIIRGREYTADANSGYAEAAMIDSAAGFWVPKIGK